MMRAYFTCLFFFNQNSRLLLNKLRELQLLSRNNILKERWALHPPAKILDYSQSMLGKKISHLIKEQDPLHLKGRGFYPYLVIK
jgi:hypothetical protein